MFLGLMDEWGAQESWVAIATNASSTRSKPLQQWGSELGGQTHLAFVICFWSTLLLGPFCHWPL